MYEVKPIIVVLYRVYVVCTLFICICCAVLSLCYVRFTQMHMLCCPEFMLCALYSNAYVVFAKFMLCWAEFMLCVFYSCTYIYTIYVHCQ